MTDGAVFANEHWIEYQAVAGFVSYLARARDDIDGYSWCLLLEVPQKDTVVSLGGKWCRLEYTRLHIARAAYRKQWLV